MFFHWPPPSNTNHPSVVVSGRGGGGDCPPSHSGGQYSGVAQLADQVHHSLKRSLESEDMPGLYEHIMRFVNAKKHAPAPASVRLAPAALGAPPPDGSLFPQPLESDSSALAAPDFGIDRRLVAPSLTGTREGKEWSLRCLSRTPVESQSFPINSSGMLNQTGQVDRHTLPSLPLPSCTPVPGARVFTCPPSPSSSDYEGPVPAYVSEFSLPFQEEVFQEEDAEWDEPISDTSHKMGRARAIDPVLDSAMTGREAEAMIAKYGGDLHPPVEPAPLAFPTHSAGLFCDALPPDPGMNLPPDFAREYDRVASADLDRRTSRAIADNFRFSKDSSEKYLTQKRPLRN